MGKSTTSTTTNKPPAWAKPLYELSGKEALSLYKSGEGFEPYKGDRVVDLNKTQLGALKDLGNLDPSNAAMDKSRGVFSAIAGGSGPSSQERFLGNIAAGKRGPSSAEANLSRIAAGNNLWGSPEFNAMLDRESGKIADATNLGFSAAGRYGSGAHTGVLADRIGDFRSNAQLANYDAERSRQLAAVGAIDAAKSNQVGQQMAAAGAMDAGKLGRVGQQMDAAGNLSNAGQQVFQNQQTAANAKLQAGTLRQQQAQEERDAKIDLYKERENLGWTRLGALQAAATGAAGPYGASVNSEPTNPLGIIGALAGMFLSERRLKLGISRVGRRGGLNVYEYAYVTGGRRYRGVMADEVEAMRPDAIVRLGNGLRAVDYSAIGIKMEVVA